MENSNPSSQLADKLSRFDQAVWGRLPKTIRKAVADYKKADQKARQRIVNNLHNVIEKHGETLVKIRFGQEQRKALFDLAWENRVIVQKDLEDRLSTVSNEFHRHFPQDKDELARRLESGRFFQTGQDWWFSRVLIKGAITLLRDISEKQEKDKDSNDNKTKGKDGRGKRRSADGGASEIKKRFSFKKAQAFFDGKDLGLPTGAEVIPTVILKKLVKSFGTIVPYKDLDDNSDDTASDFLRGKIRVMSRALEEHEVPCKIVSKKWTGYILSSSRTHS
jgi:hypothetical protein